MKLPIYQVKDEIIEAVKNHNVIIIEAETGSGKSTQVPQILLGELGLSSISTQPRRLACVSLFDRVKQEIGDDKIVGYKTAFEEEYDPKYNRILFVTDGLLVAAGIQCDYDCIIIDEVHEQSLNIETLIAWSKYHLMNSGKKIILMSATLNIEKLEYFFKEYDPITVKCPNSPYHVDVLFNDKIKHELLAVDYAIQGKNIMMFLPGKKEIEDMEYAIRKNLPSQDRYVIYQVHGDQTIDEQRPIFDNISPKVKIILCTNICQTSITVSDIDVVIDTGKAKISEIEDGMKALVLQDISQSDCLQRKGRVGRTKPGIYILSSKVPLKKRPLYPVPEIKRIFLSEIILRLAGYGIDISELEFLHQPPKKLIELAKQECIQLNALSDNQITDLGMRMSLLPLNVKTAKMLIEAESYNKDVLDAVMKVAAIQQIGGLIYHGKNGTYYGKFTDEHKSDLLAEMDIFDYIQTNHVNFKNEGLNERNYIKAEEYYRKLKNMSWNPGNKKCDTRKAVIECIIKSAVKNDIFDFRYYNMTCDLNKDRGSCVRGDLVIGTPRVIHFEKEVECNWYYDEEEDDYIEDEKSLPEVYHGELKLAVNLTAISEKDLTKYFSKCIKEHMDSTFNIFNDSFDIMSYSRMIHTNYMDIVFEKNPIKTATKNSKLYRLAYQTAYNHDVKKLGKDFLEKRKISIYGKEFFIHHLYVMNKNCPLKKTFSKVLDMRLKVKDIQFLTSLDKKKFLHISPTLKDKMFSIVILHNEDFDEQFIKQAKCYEQILIDEEPLVFIKGNCYSRDLKNFI